MYIQNKIPPKKTSSKSIKKSNTNDSVELVQPLHNSASDRCDHDYAAPLNQPQQANQPTVKKTTKNCSSPPPDPTTVRVEVVNLKHLPQQQTKINENVQLEQDSEDPQTSKQISPRQQGAFINFFFQSGHGVTVMCSLGVNFCRLIILLLLKSYRFFHFHIAGSMTLSTKRIVQRTKELAIYYQMKNSLTDIKDNVSASAIVQSLGKIFNFKYPSKNCRLNAEKLISSEP